MKKKSIFIPVLLAVLFILNTGSLAAAPEIGLSPALEIISEDILLAKCTVVTKEIKFSREDFEETLGVPVEYITITSLPQNHVGVLKYAGSDVQTGQSIPASSLGLLKFVPSRAVGSTSFDFSAGTSGESSVTCRIDVLEKQNSAPVAADMETGAVSGIGLVKSFEVYDPDGDNVNVEISAYPEKGVVKLTSEGFIYTAVPGFSGIDGFSYSVRDKYGNTSSSANVKLNVREPMTDTRYADMAGHWGYTSAIKMTELGLMNGETENGKLCFNPNEPVTRGDFLAMAMICAGLESKVTPGAVTTFADDSRIPGNIRSYASYAEAGGIINGYIGEDGKAVFASKDEITRAEAATVLSNILGNRTHVGEFDFVDAASIPAWARESFTGLVSVGIINGSPNGTLEPGRKLTRAEAAQLLCNVTEFLEAN